MAGGCSSKRWNSGAILLVLMCCCSTATQAIWLDLPSTATKCVSEDIQSNVVVLADYSLVNGQEDNASSHPAPTISVRVTSPYGNNLHHKENMTHGQFAFTTTEAGNYLACFWVGGNHRGSTGLTVSLDWRIGIAAKDWEAVAKKEKIEGVQFELTKLEGAVEAIHENLIYLKDREAEMREVSEKTNARVAWFSIMSLCVCIGVSVLQEGGRERNCFPGGCFRNVQICNGKKDANVLCCMPQTLLKRMKHLTFILFELGL